MTEPRLAWSLVTLRSEVDARWPMRNKASDGWIGNPAHAATASDHNPNADGVVCALDLTNDPDSGADMTVISERLRIGRHPDVKYVIRHWSREMFSAYAAHGVEPFTWRAYSGAAARELHVSVGVGRDGKSVEPYDDTASWFAPAPPPSPVPTPTTQGAVMIFGHVTHPDRGELLYVVGDDKAAWERSEHGWNAIGGIWTDAGDAYLGVDGKVELVGRGGDGAAWQLTVDAHGVQVALDSLDGHIYPPA